MKKELFVIIATVIIAALVIGAIEYGGLGKAISFNGNYAFDVEIKDPSFSVVNVNNTYMVQDLKVANYSYNSTALKVNLPLNWSANSANYLYELVNTISTPVSVNLSDNFTNGAVFTYLLMQNGQVYSSGIVHNATFWVMTQNNATGNYSTSLVVVHNIIGDGEFVPNGTMIPANSTLYQWGILGDGLPVLANTTVVIPAGYYVYVGIGNLNWGIQNLARNTGNITNSAISNTTTKTFESGSLTIS